MLLRTIKWTAVRFPCRFFSQLSVLPHEVDRFNGVLVRSGDWSNDTTTIRTQLSTSLDQWRKDKRTSAWLWVPIEKSHVIPVAAELGFLYHHAEDRLAVLNQWLLPTKTLVPRFATHQVGVAGAVLREKTNELLIIKESFGRREFWKLPGGSTELGEDIAEGAIREVFEETGIQSKFESIVAFRQVHNHPGGHGRSDLYFICRLSALSDTINMDRNEVLDCRWMPLEEVLKLKNPILQRVAQQLIFGLEHGFQQSIDLCLEKIPSIVTGLTFDFFTRGIKLNE